MKSAFITEDVGGYGSRSIHMDFKQGEVPTLGGGCFWGPEDGFSELNGVMKAEPAYSEGKLPNPIYQKVSMGRSGHAEGVENTFNPNVLSTREILNEVFAGHHLNTLNRQGADIGTQHRSK